MRPSAAFTRPKRKWPRASSAAAFTVADTRVVKVVFGVPDVVVAGLKPGGKLSISAEAMPGALLEGWGESRRRRGYRELTQGLAAVAAGDGVEAQKHARKSEQLLSEPALTLLLLPMAHHVLARTSPLWAHWKRYALLGLLGVGLYNSLQYLALQTSTPINVTLVASSTPMPLFFLMRVG